MKFKYVLRSWLIFDDIDYKPRINVPNENINETTENERYQHRDEAQYSEMETGTVMASYTGIIQLT